MSPAVAAVGLLVLATGSIWLGAILGSKKPEPKDEITDETLDLTWWQVMIMPVTSSLFLLLLFYYFEYIQLIMIIFIIAGSGISCVDVLRSSVSAFAPSVNTHLTTVLSVLFTLYVIVQWAINGSFIAHDILGCSICISSIALIRFPSLKLAAVSLSLLLLYDLFWVFYSEYFFHKNVMVEVAIKSAINPIQALGVKYDISILSALQPKLELPIKLLMPSTLLPGGRLLMLGLGDIALPGFLISLALRCDMYHSSRLELPIYSPDTLLQQQQKSKTKINNRQSLKLFENGIFGYILGLLAAFYIGSISGHAQPALIYLVPGVMVPISVRAWRMNVFLEVWNGPSKVND